MSGALESTHARPTRVLMTVDDAGDFLLCAGDDISIGHARGAAADLPVLADVGVEHARFQRRSSLTGGSDWLVVPLAGERVSRNAEPITSPVAVADGDALLLGTNLRVIFRQPDPASASAVLDLLGGVDCLGAAHVVLLAPGVGGRVRIGARGGRHVRVPNLEPGFELALAPGGIAVTSAAGIGLGAAERASEVLLPFPPERRMDLSVGAPLPGGRPPFSFSLAAVS
jgi:hypothetical protein